MKVSEVFYSVQGEGYNIGLPSIFVRLSGCNLKCVWCDTKYALKGGRNVEFDVLAHEVDELRDQNDCNHIVITGGEPLTQVRGLGKFIDVINSSGFTYEIETNGTIPPSQLISNMTYRGGTNWPEYWNVSPKLASSKNDVVKAENETAMIEFVDRANHQKNVCFKFVISGSVIGFNNDWTNMSDLVCRYHIQHDHIVVMPEGIDSLTQVEALPELIDKVKEYPSMRVIPRLHILAYDNKRGV